MEGPRRRHGRVLFEVPQRRCGALIAGPHLAPGARTAPESARPGRATTTPRKRILCAACTTACPCRSGPSRSHVGPAAIVNAHRFIYDSRDHAEHERLEILADENGVWRCRTRNPQQSSTRATARHQHRRAILEARGRRGGALRSGGEPRPASSGGSIIRRTGASTGKPGPASVVGVAPDRRGQARRRAAPDAAAAGHDLRGTGAPDQQRR